MIRDHDNFLSIEEERLRSTTAMKECGCKTGMVALVVGLSASTYYYFFDEPLSTQIVFRCLYVLLISLGCAVLGKIVGMVAPKLRRNYQKVSNKKEEGYGSRSL